MKRVLLIALAAVLTVGAAGNAAAQKFEFGARVGVGSQDMDMNFAGVRDARSRLGFNIAAVSRIRLIGLGDGLLGAGLFLQPEVVYSQNNLKMERFSGSSDLSHREKIRMKTVDIPLLVSLKVSIVRIQAGPVFNLMNDFKTVDGGLELLPLRPAVGYAFGASVDLLGLTLDARYHGEFKKMSFKGDWTDIKSRFSSWSVGVGMMF